MLVDQRAQCPIFPREDKRWDRGHILGSQRAPIRSRREDMASSLFAIRPKRIPHDFRETLMGLEAFGEETG
jgi:hypothetical protein